LLAAPFIPFFAEHLFEKVHGKESVHVQDWPYARAKKQETRLEKDMEKTREIASKGLAARAKAGLRVRQPLASATIKENLENPLLELLKDELNVKEILVNTKATEAVELDMKLTPALKEEGLVRELLRSIQDMRKDAKYKPGDLALMRYSGESDLGSLFLRHEAHLKKAGSLRELAQGDRPKEVFDVEKEVVLQGKKLWMGIKKV
jgi:isoleucyl-tRNA synthetase